MDGQMTYETTATISDAAQGTHLYPRWRYLMTIGWAAVLAVFFVLTMAGCENGESEDTSISSPKSIAIATIFYQWFGYEHDAQNGWTATGGLGTFHWNDIVDNQLVTGFVANRPEIGYYASDSDDTIAWQLRKMEEAGIDTIIVSWWGWGDADLDGTFDGYIEQRNHDALIRLLNYIQLRSLKFKIAVMVEPWPDIVTPTPDHVPEPGTAKNLSSDQKQMILDYVWDNIYSVYPDLIFRWQGSPLLAAVGELYFDPDEDSPNDRFTLRSFRLKDDDIDPGNSWDWIITEPLPYFQAVDRTVILSPRYDEWFLAAAHPAWWPDAWGRTEPVRHDPYLEEDLYDSEWRQIHSQRDDVDLVILWAWNSWMEQLYIEPDNGEGAAPAGQTLVRKTEWYVRRFISGAPFKLFSPLTGSLCKIPTSHSLTRERGQTYSKETP